LIETIPIFIPSLLGFIQLLELTERGGHSAGALASKRATSLSFANSMSLAP
jgi:hypothetical protein